MKQVTTLLPLLFLSGNLLAQAFYHQNFDAGLSFPAGWSSTDSRIAPNFAVSAQSTGYSVSDVSPEASGGNNVIFQQCSPNTNTILYLNCAGVINTTGKTSIRVGFGRRTTGAFDREVSFEYSINGTDWPGIDANVGVGGAWASTYYDLPSEAAGVSNLRFRFGYVSDVNTNCTAPPNFRIDDFTVGENASLPVTLVNFFARPNPSNITLSWLTATEKNSDYFQVERSPNWSNFEAIATVAAAGESASSLDYSFVDEHPIQGKNYYRLRQVDFDGKYSFSPIVTAIFGTSVRLTLAPVPATETLHLKLEKPAKDDGQWQVFDMQGRRLLSGEMWAETKEQSINIAELPVGAYVLRLMVGQEVMVEKFRKN